MPNPERSPEPHRIITDDTVFEIINPKQGKRIYLTLSPDGTLTTRLEDLTPPEELKLEAESQFTSIVRHLILYSVENQAAQVRPGSEEVGPELAALDWEAQFRQGVIALTDMHLSNREIQQMVRGQGRLFTIGQEHIGFTPSIIKEQVVRLNRFVADYFNNRAKQQSQMQRGRSR